MTGTPSDDELMALLDGELTAERRAAIEAWLAERPAEAARVAHWRAHDAALKAIFGSVADEPVPQRLAEVLEQPPARPRWPLVAAGLALFVAGAAAGSGATLSFSATPPNNAANVFVDQAIASHRLYTAEVRHAVEVTAADEPHLRTWLSRRLDHPLKPPDLHDVGLALVGGRLVPCRGEPSALLMYETASGERFTLVVGRNKGEAASAFRWRESLGVGTLAWRDGVFDYVLVGPSDKERLKAVARAIYERST